MRSVNKSGAWRGEGWGSEKRQKRKDGHIEELPIEGGGVKPSAHYEKTFRRIFLV